MEKSLKWTGLILCSICMSLTAVNVYPTNVFFGILGNGFWTAAGIYTKDMPLTISSMVSFSIFFVGAIIFLLS